MTHLMVEDDLQAQIESTRMDIKRTWPNNLPRALQAQIAETPYENASRATVVYLIAILTLGIEEGVIV